MPATDKEVYVLPLGRLINYDYEVISQDSTENKAYPLPGIEKQSIIIRVPDPEGEVYQNISKAREAGKRILLTTRIQGMKQLQTANYKESSRGFKEYEPGVLQPYVLIYADLLLKRLENSL